MESDRASNRNYTLEFTRLLLGKDASRRMAVYIIRVITVLLTAACGLMTVILPLQQRKTKKR